MFEALQALLPADGSLWRVEWMDGVRLNRCSSMGYEVKVAFRQITPTPDFAALPRVQIVHIGIRHLAQLPLGSLWSDGRRLPEPPHAAIPYELNLCEGDGSADTVSYEFVEPKRPARGGTFGSLSIPPGMENGYVMRIRITNPHTRLLELRIPLFEIARAQFLRDPELATQLLSAPIDEAVALLHDTTRTTTDPTGRARVFIHKELREDSIPLVAALVTQPSARRAASRMFDRILQARSLGNVTALEALPVVNGPWRIRAAGCWGEKSKRGTFYVHRLDAIEPPKLGLVEWSTWDSDYPGPPGGPAGQRQSEFSVPSLSSTAASPPATLTSGDRTHAGSTRAATDLRAKVPSGVASGHVFDLSQMPKPSRPAVGTPPDWRRVPSAFRYRSTWLGSSPPSNRMALSPGIERMVNILRKLQQDSALRVRAVGGGVTTLDRPGVLLTALPVDVAWSMLESRPRHALCVEVVHDQNFLYLFEIERRVERETLPTILIGRGNGETLLPADIDAVLRDIALASGRADALSGKYWRKSLVHKFKSDASFIRRMKQIVVGHFSVAGERSAGDSRG